MLTFNEDLRQIIFDNREQYNLFMKYLNDTPIDHIENITLEKYYTPDCDEGSFTLSLANKQGAKAVVSKFMEVTRMMEIDYTKHMGTSYKPDKDPHDLPLGNDMHATIHSHTIHAMHQYRQKYFTPREEPINKDAATKKKEETIINTISLYRDHLRKKMENEGLFEYASSYRTTAKQDKLIKRYEAINNVYYQINKKSSLNGNEFENVKDAVSTCLRNKPEWSERSFLQKLTDILSLGLKLLYRGFFSKEKQLEEKLQNELDLPSHRHK